MKPLPLHEIRQLLSAKALCALPAEAPMIAAVCTDTRRIDKGALFVALRGDRFNGHDFVPAAAAGGAVAALVEQPPPTTLPNVLLLQVDDTRKALGKLARHIRLKMRAKVIAVGGSNGKTSTKHLIDAALRGKLNGSISPKSFNNDIGVPLTIFPADPNQDYLVLELGTNHHGEMRVLTDIARPDLAVITNCGPEHLEGLGDLMGVRREEASIVEGLDPRGLLVVNGDDPELLEAVRPYPGKRVTFGFASHNDLFATDVRCGRDGVHFCLNNSRREVFVPLLGRHTAANALAAIAVGRRMGLSEEAIIESLRGTRGPDMRLQLQETGEVSVLNDAYNANPASMEAALQTLADMRTEGRKIAVLGDMRELGEAAERFHRQLGAHAASCGLDALCCVGSMAPIVAKAAAEAGLADVTCYENADAAAAAIPARLRAGDLVLLKASRGIRLEAVAAAIGERKQAALRAAS